MKKAFFILFLTCISAIQALAQGPTPTAGPSQTGTATTVPTATPTVIPAATGSISPVEGPVSGSISPATPNILLYIVRQEDPNVSEGSCLTDSLGRFSCSVSQVGYFVVRPNNNSYTFNPDSFVALSGVESNPFAALETAIGFEGCKTKDNSVKINKANVAAKNLLNYSKEALTAAKAAALKVKNTKAKAKLDSALTALENKAIVPFSLALAASEELPEVVLSCKKNVKSCKRQSLAANKRTFKKQVKAIQKIPNQISKAVGKVREGGKLSVKIAEKTQKLYNKSVKAADKLPASTFSCTG